MPSPSPRSFRLLHRSSHMLIRALALLVSALVVLSVLAAWRLSQGPIAIDWLAPYVREAIAPPDTDLDVQVGSIELRFGGERVATLVLVDLMVASKQGEPVLEVPEAEVDLSLSALLLHGAIAPIRLEMEVSRLVLVRAADGTIGLRGAPRTADTNEAGSKIDLQRLAERLLHEPEPGRPLSYLKQVSIAGDRMTLRDRVTDQQIDARAGRLELARTETVRAQLGFDVPRGERVIRAKAKGDFDGARLALQADLSGLMPADLAPYVNQPALRGIGLRLRAHASTTVDLKKGPGPIAFGVTSAPGTIDLPDHLTVPLEVDQIQINGVLGGDFQTARLQQLTLEALGARLEASGRAAWPDGELTVQGEVRAKNVNVADFERLWPKTAATEARKWAIPNVRAGHVPEAFAAIDIPPGDLGKEPIPRTMASGWFSFEDLAVQYFEGFPLIEGIDGKASFDGYVLAFEGGGGRAQGLNLEHGRVAITGMTVPGKYATRLHVLADVSGPVGDALSLLDREPLGFPSELGIDPAKSRGNVRTRLQLGLPLYKDVEAEVLDVTASAELDDVAIDDLQGQADVKNGDLHLDVAGGGMKLSGQATVAGVPMTLSVSESFAESSNAPRGFSVQTDLEPATLAHLGVPDDLPLAFTGKIGANIDGSEADDGTIRLDVDLDLASADLGLPLAGWHKAAGAAGRASAVVTIPSSGAIGIDTLRLHAQGLDAAGRLRLSQGPLALELADFDRLHLGPQHLSARVTRHGDGLNARIRATELTLDPMLDAGFGEDDANDQAPSMRLALDFAADRITLNEGTLQQVRLTATRAKTGWREADLEAVLAEGKQVKATLTPAENRQIITLTSDDAGGLITLFAEQEPIAGGQLRLQGQLRQQQPQIDLSGNLTIDQFTIKKAPTLARILTLLSAQGIEDVVSGRRLAMTRLELPFHLKGQELMINRARTWGSGLGLTAEGRVDLATERVDLTGTVLPAYGLNWAISKIPVIGNFLAGSDGEGAFAATYSVSGPFVEPSVRVNPLSVLAPGFIRDLFAGKGKSAEMLPDSSN